MWNTQSGVASAVTVLSSAQLRLPAALHCEIVLHTFRSSYLLPCTCEPFGPLLYPVQWPPLPLGYRVFQDSIFVLHHHDTINAQNSPPPPFLH